MSHVLTFDLGTTYFKACVFDQTGRLLSLARTATPIDRPAPDWRQIDPRVFLETLTSLAMELRGQDAKAYDAIGSVSFATQTNSFLLLDERDEPLTPIILWNDRRAEALRDRVDDLTAGPALRNETGLPALTPSFAIAKLLWLQTNQPDLWRRASSFVLIGDYLTWWLTGRRVTEGGAAGLTGLLNIHTLRWRESLRMSIGADRLALPEPQYAGADLGPLLPPTAERLQLPSACRCVLGCLDQYAGAIGAGNIEPGGISETTGTVLTTVALARTYAADLSPAVYQGPAWQPGLYWRMCVGSVSANLLEALRRAEPDRPDYDTLNREAAAVPAGADGLRLDRAASAAAEQPIYVNHQPHHTRGHRVRAIYEAVAEALRDQVRDLIGDAARGTPIRAVGGAARSKLWLQIMADTLGRSMIALDCSEPTSLGAAMLGTFDLSAKTVRTGTGSVTHRAISPTGATR